MSSPGDAESQCTGACDGVADVQDVRVLVLDGNGPQAGGGYVAEMTVGVEARSLQRVYRASNVTLMAMNDIDQLIDSPPAGPFDRIIFTSHGAHDGPKWRPTPVWVELTTPTAATPGVFDLAIGYQKQMGVTLVSHVKLTQAAALGPTGVRGIVEQRCGSALRCNPSVVSGRANGTAGNAWMGQLFARLRQFNDAAPLDAQCIERPSRAFATFLSESLGEAGVASVDYVSRFSLLSANCLTPVFTRDTPFAWIPDELSGIEVLDELRLARGMTTLRHLLTSEGVIILNNCNAAQQVRGIITGATGDVIPDGAASVYASRTQHRTIGPDSETSCGLLSTNVEGIEAFLLGRSRPRPAQTLTLFTPTAGRVTTETIR